MLTELKFVQGSVSSKDILPALTHFAIEGNTVRGYNGVIALCSPIPFDICCKPKAVPLIRAIANCEDSIQLSLTPSNRLSIKSGKFKAFIDCVDGETPHVLAEGQPFAIDGKMLLQAFKVLYPLVSTDASRPWSQGILLDGSSAFATNNIILAEYWLGSSVPFPVNIPRAAIKEIVRIGEAPEGALVTNSSITFMYSGQRWLRSQLLATDWPDVRGLLNSAVGDPKPIDRELFDGLEILKPFTDKMGKIFFECNLMSTHIDCMEGATYDLHSDLGQSVYNIDMLQLLNPVVTSIDWSLYPKPCPWQGNRIRGLIVGLKT